MLTIYTFLMGTLLAAPTLSAEDPLVEICKKRTQALEQQTLQTQQLEDELRKLVDQLERNPSEANSSKLRYKIVVFGHQMLRLGKLEHERTLACDRKLDWTKDIQ